MPYHGSTLAEDAGAYDREHLRIDAMIVVEAVDDSARDEQHIARAYLGLRPRGAPRQDADAGTGEGYQELRLPSLLEEARSA
jgi:hypothetical protein